MYRYRDRTISVGRIVTLLLSMSLVFSFGLHSIQIAHTHYGGTHTEENEHHSKGEQLGEYMHVADKKLFVIFFAIFIAPWTFLNSFTTWQRKSLWRLEQQWSFRIRSLQRAWNANFEYFRIFFRKGILHTKVFWV